MHSLFSKYNGFISPAFISSCNIELWTQDKNQHVARAYY